jgi:hypothetical protein
MRIEDALRQVRTIQSQLALTQRCCCYRSATVAVSGLLALLAAATQAVHLRDPVTELRQYLTLWISVAVLSVAVIGVEMFVRWLHVQTAHARRQTIAALRQFAPSLTAGALLTWAIATTGSQHAALLPGLWAILLGLGIFASAIYLPATGLAVGAYYVLTGIVCVVWGNGDQALQPWTMTITFGVGQALAAGVLYRRHEAAREASDE